MRKPPPKLKCEKSKFEYTLVVKPDGTIKLKDKDGNCIKSRGQKKLPPVKRIVNTRKISIIEATGSPRWIFLDPPGRWYLL